MQRLDAASALGNLLPGVSDTSIVGLAMQQANGACAAKTEGTLSTIALGGLSAFTGMPLVLLGPLLNKFFQCPAGRAAMKNATNSCVTTTNAAQIEGIIAALAPGVYSTSGFKQPLAVSDILEQFTQGSFESKVLFEGGVSQDPSHILTPQELRMILVNATVECMSVGFSTQVSIALAMRLLKLESWATLDKQTQAGFFYGDINRISNFQLYCSSGDLSQDNSSQGWQTYLDSFKALAPGSNTSPNNYSSSPPMTQTEYNALLARNPAIGQQFTNIITSACATLKSDIAAANQGVINVPADPSSGRGAQSLPSALAYAEADRNYQLILAAFNHCLQAATTALIKAVDPASYDSLLYAQAHALLGDSGGLPNPGAISPLIYGAAALAALGLFLTARKRG